MDLQQAKILLEKINSLQKSIALNKGPIAAIERDLMLSYIRQLYEIYLDSDMPAVAVSIPAVEETNISPKPTEIEPPRREYTPPVMKEKPEPPKVTVPKQETPPLPPVQRTIANHQANFSALFDFKQARELSEKLGERPITDLTKAFAINDKLLYINELFGRDANAFNDSLRTMNNFENMDEARSLLMSMAEQYNWADEEKLEIAQGFIRTIRRRYV